MEGKMNMCIDYHREAINDHDKDWKKYIHFVKWEKEIRFYADLWQANAILLTIKGMWFNLLKTSAPKRQQMIVIT